MEYQHESRYLFAPSAYALGKGAGYYNTILGLMHDVQFGLGDWFSLRMGTSLLALPVYLTTKFTIPLNDQSSQAFGDLATGAPYTFDELIDGQRESNNAFGNLVYGLYTRRFSGNNISFVAGYWMNNENEFSEKFGSPVFSLSRKFRLTKSF